MHIEFVRTGGFAGIRLSAAVDTQGLPAEQASTLDRLIADADFFKLPEKLIQESPARDRFEYTLTVAAAGQTHSIEVNDAGAPESLRPLLNFLTTLAMVSRKS
jgi:hypothetical protein